MQLSFISSLEYTNILVNSILYFFCWQKISITLFFIFNLNFWKKKKNQEKFMMLDAQALLYTSDSQLNQQHYLHPKYLLLYNSDSALVANKIAQLLPHRPTETKPQ